MIWVYRNIFGPKNHTRKIDKIHKNFELYEFLMHNYLCQTVPIFSDIYHSQKDSIHFSLEVSKYFSLRVSKSVGPKK